MDVHTFGTLVVPQWPWTLHTDIGCPCRIRSYACSYRCLYDSITFGFTRDGQGRWGASQCLGRIHGSRMLKRRPARHTTATKSRLCCSICCIRIGLPEGHSRVDRLEEDGPDHAAAAQDWNLLEGAALDYFRFSVSSLYTRHNRTNQRADRPYRAEEAKRGAGDAFASTAAMASALVPSTTLSHCPLNPAPAESNTVMSDCVISSRTLVLTLFGFKSLQW
jgi:hypothetical protein